MYFFTEALLLVIALSLDTFTACFAFGIDRIRVPFTSAVMINVIGSGLLLLSLLCGSLIRTYVAPSSGITAYISFAILLTIGVIRLLDVPLKHLIRRLQRARLKKRNGICRFILAIYADSQEADVNRSKSISVKEAVTLSIALSIDSVAAGLSAGMIQLNVWIVFLLAFVFGMAAVFGGYLIGKRVAAMTSIDLSWAGGVLLIALAVLRLV